MKNKYTIDGPVTYIEVSIRGKTFVTEIDTVDLPIANSIPGTWYVMPKGGNLYVFTTIGKKSLYLHRLLTGNVRGLVVDHINRNTLDNKRSSNLRTVTQAQNVQNRRAKRTSLSGERGVSWHKPSSKWQARGQVNGKDHYLGLYDTKEEAAAEVQAWRLKNMPYSYEGGSLVCV